MPQPCLDLQGNEVPCGTEQLGEQYYSAVQSGDPSAVTDWWQQHLGFFLAGNEDIDINDPAQFNQWMQTYGTYFSPMQFDETDYNRVQREAGLKKEQLKMQYMEGTPQQQLQEGQRGFSSTGGTASLQSNMWDEYSRGLQGIESVAGAEVQDIYSSFGDQFLQMNVALAGMGAFGDPDLTEGGSFSYQQPETDDFIPDETDVFEFDSLEECLSSCYETTGDYSGCSQQCLD